MAPTAAGTERDAIAAFLAMQQKALSSKSLESPVAVDEHLLDSQQCAQVLEPSPVLAEQPRPTRNSRSPPCRSQLQPLQLNSQFLAQQSLLLQQQQPQPLQSAPCQQQEALKTQRHPNQNTIVLKETGPAAPFSAVSAGTAVQALGDRQQLAALQQPLQPQPRRPQSPCKHQAAPTGAPVNPTGLGPLAAGLFRNRNNHVPGNATANQVPSGAAIVGSGVRGHKSPPFLATAVATAALPGPMTMQAAVPPPALVSSALAALLRPNKVLAPTTCTLPRDPLEFGPLQANLLNNPRARLPESSVAQLALAAGASAAVAAPARPSSGAVGRPGVCNPFGNPGQRSNQHPIAYGGWVDDESCAVETICGSGPAPPELAFGPEGPFNVCNNKDTSGSSGDGGGGRANASSGLVAVPAAAVATALPPARKISAEPLPLSRFARCNSNDAGSGSTSVRRDAVLNAAVAAAVTNAAVASALPGVLAVASQEEASSSTATSITATSAAISTGGYTSWSSESSVTQPGSQPQQQPMPAAMHAKPLQLQDGQEQALQPQQLQQLPSKNVLQQQQQKQLGEGQWTQKQLPQQDQEQHQPPEEKDVQQRPQAGSAESYTKDPISENNTTPDRQQRQLQERQQQVRQSHQQQQPQQRLHNQHHLPHEAHNVRHCDYHRRQRLRQTCEYQAKQFLQQQLLQQQRQQEDAMKDEQPGTQQQHQTGLPMPGPMLPLPNDSWKQQAPGEALAQRKKPLSALKMPAWMRKVVQQRLAADASGDGGGGIGADDAGWHDGGNTRGKRDTRHSRALTFATVVEAEEEVEEDNDNGSLPLPEACPSPVVGHEALLFQGRRLPPLQSSIGEWWQPPPPPPSLPQPQQQKTLFEMQDYKEISPQQRQQKQTPEEAIVPTSAARRLDWAVALLESSNSSSESGESKLSTEIGAVAVSEAPRQSEFAAEVVAATEVVQDVVAGARAPEDVEQAADLGLSAGLEATGEAQSALEAMVDARTGIEAKATDRIAAELEEAAQEPARANSAAEVVAALEAVRKVRDVLNAEQQWPKSSSGGGGGGVGNSEECNAGKAEPAAAPNGAPWWQALGSQGQGGRANRGSNSARSSGATSKCGSSSSSAATTGCLESVSRREHSCSTDGGGPTFPRSPVQELSHQQVQLQQEHEQEHDQGVPFQGIAAPADAQISSGSGDTYAVLLQTAGGVALPSPPPSLADSDASPLQEVPGRPMHSEVEIAAVVFEETEPAIERGGSVGILRVAPEALSCSADWEAPCGETKLAVVDDAAGSVGDDQVCAGAGDELSSAPGKLGAEVAAESTGEKCDRDLDPNGMVAWEQPAIHGDETVRDGDEPEAEANGEDGQCSGCRLGGDEKEALQMEAKCEVKSAGTCGQEAAACMDAAGCDLERTVEEGEVNGREQQQQQGLEDSAESKGEEDE